MLPIKRLIYVDVAFWWPWTQRRRGVPPLPYITSTVPEHRGAVPGKPRPVPSLPGARHHSRKSPASSVSDVHRLYSESPLGKHSLKNYLYDHVWVKSGPWDKLCVASVIISVSLALSL